MLLPLSTASHHADPLTLILLAAAVALVYVALVFVRPLRACPKCHGERVLRKGRRARICPRCKGYGKTRRVGASMVHRMWWDARSERAKDGED